MDSTASIQFFVQYEEQDPNETDPLKRFATESEALLVLIAKHSITPCGLCKSGGRDNPDTSGGYFSWFAPGNKNL